MSSVYQRPEMGSERPLPSHMRALILESPLQMKLASVPIPAPGEGEVLVQVRAATTCGTDLKAFRRGHPQIPMPGPLGHEYSGVVAAVGPNAPFQVGDVVMGVHSAPCQACRWCLAGQENLCEHIMATKVLGSFAEYLLIPARVARLNLFAKPDALSFEMAALLEPLACVAQGIQLLQFRPESRVLVIGPGAIGLMFVAALRLLGLNEVVLAGRNESRLAAGTQLGARAIKLAEITEKDFDIVIECTGTVEIWERSVDFVRRGGIVMLFGGCPGGTRASFDTHRLHYDQITLVSPFHFGTRAVSMAREWLLAGINLGPLLSGDRSLEDYESVFANLTEGKGLKYVFRP